MSENHQTRNVNRFNVDPLRLHSLWYWYRLRVIHAN